MNKIMLAENRKASGLWQRDGVTVISVLRAPLIIHVNMHVIRKNIRDEQTEPPISIRRGKTGAVILRCHDVQTSGPCNVVYRSKAPLACGARLWMQTLSSITCR
jgi:hypothetical protein